MAIDGAGRIYTADGNDHYVACTTISADNLSATTKELGVVDKYGDQWDPVALAFDRAGNLYVADLSGAFGGKNGCVFEFAPGATTPEATFTGLDEPQALAFDANDNLYVANWGNSTVSEFTSGSTTPTGTFSNLDSPAALTFDDRGNLLVANAGNNTISEFTPAVASVAARP